MKIIIAEDEPLAQDRLKNMLLSLDTSADIIATVESRAELKEIILSGIETDLLLLDIELADGKSIDLFNEIEIDIPVIFTTAYDQYALEAFNFMSVGYLLKPIQLPDLKAAVLKSKKFSPISVLPTTHVVTSNADSQYKSKFLIKSGNKLIYKSVNDVNYFFAEGKEVYLIDQDNRKFLIDHSLDELDNSLDHRQFFRISRKIIINVETVGEIRGFSSARLEVKSNKGAAHPLLISRGRVKQFKAWLDR